MNSRRGSTTSPIRVSKRVVGLVGLVDLDLEQGALVRVERGLPELLRVHLAQALVALDREALAAGQEQRLDQPDRAGHRHDRSLRSSVAGVASAAPMSVSEGRRTTRVAAAGHGGVEPEALAALALGLDEHQLAGALRAMRLPRAAAGAAEQLCDALRHLERAPLVLHGLIGEPAAKAMASIRSTGRRRGEMGQQRAAGSRLVDQRAQALAVDDVAAAGDELGILQALVDQEGLERRVVLEVALLLATLDPVERRLGDVEMTRAR